MPRRTLLALPCLALILVTGCGEPKRETANLTGKVMFKGKPIPAGFISFMPDVPGGNSGEQKGFPITNGVYDTAQGANPGIYPGANVVTIMGYDGKAEQLWPQGKQIFNPAQFKETVKAGSKDFEIPESAGRNVKITPTADAPGGI